jgi:hypothetical protein
MMDRIERRPARGRARAARVQEGAPHRLATVIPLLSCHGCIRDEGVQYKCGGSWNPTVARRGVIPAERVLVCVIGQTRGHELSWSSFKSCVLDELTADLAVCIGVDSDYDYTNPFWQHAKYRWTAPEYSDYGDAFDYAQRWLCANGTHPDWRPLLRIKDLWLGGIVGEEAHPGSAAILMFFRWLLLHSLERDGVLENYDRFVVTRSDFVWTCPHPPLEILDPERLWFPAGEWYGGVTDRHVVAARRDLPSYLDLIRPVLTEPERLQKEMGVRDDWNFESYIAYHLAHHGMTDRISYFPYVMYSVRKFGAGTRWAAGRFEPSVRQIVKYPSELVRAMTYAGRIRSRADWLGGAWRDLTPPSLERLPDGSFYRRARFRIERAVVKRLEWLLKWVKAARSSKTG